jgi:hypothetical protein
MSLILAFLLQAVPLQEYGERAAGLSPDDALAHYRLGLWCEKEGLAGEAKAEFEKAVLADPSYVPPRKKLSHRKIGSTWVAPDVSAAVEKGIQFPSEEETSRMRALSGFHSRVIDLFWNRENWAVALSRIRDWTGLYTGTLEIQVRFGRLDTAPAMGGGTGGSGTITLDVDRLAAYEKTIGEFAKKVAAGGRMVVPPARTTAIITHELTHCFQGTGAPSWFLEGMASWCAGDGHFVYYFRHAKEKVLEIDEVVDRKFVYARGWGFFEYVHARHGPAALRRMMYAVLGEGKPVSVFLGELSGEEWSSVKKKELTWTRRWIRTYRHQQ